MHLLTPENFHDYELIDTGNFEKLERFGKYITIRPEPQAVWGKNLSEQEWEKQAQVKFISKSSSAGTWKKLKDMPDRWNMKYEIRNEESENKNLVFRLGLTSFKHVGIFPEQAVNWNYIYDSIEAIKSNEAPKILNLFAYTGGASLAAKAAGADITHLDSIKQVVTWARENMELSGLKNIRWMVEDAMTYVKREVKRGKKYQGIILDPPAYGHGPNGESWKLEDEINDMMKMVAQLLDEKNHFLILNTYSLGFSSLILENIFDQYFDKKIKRECGEVFLQSTTGQKLPLGVFARHIKI
jgi:23S rRNA (cytosine1962-C5)-methyltransferase